MTHHSSPTLDSIISFCKRRGFIYPSGEIYGGLTGTYDFGPLGVILKDNLISCWKRSLLETEANIVFLDGAILGAEAIWGASGHTEFFNDPMVDCLSCKKRYRADEIAQDQGCPSCGKKSWTPIRQFNMMFQTSVGAAADQTMKAYLRPETAQSIFINFKNIVSTMRIKIPFGIGQIGKAFRNEITPRQFLFRVREFQQMELEWFCKKEDAETYFKLWIESRFNFYSLIGINKDNIRITSHSTSELAHYAQACNDIEYHYPFGWKELEGIANRGTYDLTQHAKHSGKDLSVYDDETKTSYIPTVIESSVGIDRLFLTVIFDAYDQDTIENEPRVVLRLSPHLAPIKAAFFPLTKKLAIPMKKIYQRIQNTVQLPLQYDESASIGKRYRRQDEIGTPVCFTYDFESEKDHCVTVRNRDTAAQERIHINRIDSYLNNMLHYNKSIT